MTETQGISHVFVSEGGQRKLKYRAEQYGNSNTIQT